MFERGLLRDEDLGPLGDAVLTVLEKVGALYQGAEILDALDGAAAGARLALC